VACVTRVSTLRCATWCAQVLVQYSRCVALPDRRIPDATVARLPVYQRVLMELVKGGTRSTSSEQIAAMVQVNASKVRKDLSFLGSFGTRGTGYDTSYLLEQIERALGLERVWPVLIVGLGNLGRALANSEGFISRGFVLAGLFDVDPALVGSKVAGVVVRHVDELATGAPGVSAPAIGVVTTPAAVAQQVADLLVAAGVGCILNFAPRVLSVPAGILLRQVDLSIELQVMSFYLSHGVPDGSASVNQGEMAARSVARSVGLGA